MIIFAMMANTYSKIYIHAVFAVKNRDHAIPPHHETEIHRYIGGVLRNHDQIPISIGGTDNHVHILFIYANLNQTIPDLIREIKRTTSAFVNNNRIIKCRFEWQRGYGAFSYSHSHVPAVRKYVQSQHDHHHGVSLEDEVRKILDAYEIEYDPRYIIRDE